MGVFCEYNHRSFFFSSGLALMAYFLKSCIIGGKLTRCSGGDSGGGLLKFHIFHIFFTFFFPLHDRYRTRISIEKGNII